MRLLLLLLLLPATSCATTTTPTSSADAARDAAALLAAAEAAHRCAAEDADDDNEAAAFAACITNNTAQAQALLPRVKAAGVMAPGELAAVRLFLDDVSSAERTNCGRLPAESARRRSACPLRQLTLAEGAVQRRRDCATIDAVEARATRGQRGLRRGS